MSDTNITSEAGNNKKDPPEEQVREISLEEFNPKGTLTLTLLYFVLLLFLWFFMYFIEFAGRGPSILS